MKAVVQRVSHASVTVNGEVVGEIGAGLMVLVGIAESDEGSDIEFLAKKIPAMRVFPDPEGKMNLSLLDMSGELLLVSQFTLIADTSKGNRPSFFQAAKPAKAAIQFEELRSRLQNTGVKVATGIFGADMKVSLLNDGPVTILLDSKEKS